MKLLLTEKEGELRRLREEATRRDRWVSAEIEGVTREEAEIDDENNVMQYCVNGLKAKVEELKEVRDEAKRREMIIIEKMRIDAKMELEMVGYEFNSELLAR